ncbi:MAG TPA: phosphatase PAP2 family protein [Thermoanaerobaculia bacterium]
MATVWRITAIGCIAFLLRPPPAAHAASPASLAPPDCVEASAPSTAENAAGPLGDSGTPPPPIADEADPAATGPSTLRRLPGMALDDAVCVLGSPVRWSGEQWVIAGGAVAGIVVVGAFADVVVREHMLSHRSGALDDLTRVVEPFGQEYSLAVLGAYGLVGFVFHDADARDTAIDGALASILASGIITPSLKLVIGRSRPNETDDPLRFQPFQGGNDTAMPSGHATQAFAVASVISAHSDRFWVSASAYGLASLVAFSRLYHNAHWTSDVVAGALIGTLVGRTVVAVNNRIRAGDRTVHVAFAPILAKDQKGAGLTIVF